MIVAICILHPTPLPKGFRKAPFDPEYAKARRPKDEHYQHAKLTLPTLGFELQRFNEEKEVSDEGVIFAGKKELIEEIFKCRVTHQEHKNHYDGTIEMRHFFDGIPQIPESLRESTQTIAFPYRDFAYERIASSKKQAGSKAGRKAKMSDLF